jgi:hypothetical protein
VPILHPILIVLDPCGKCKQAWGAEARPRRAWGEGRAGWGEVEAGKGRAGRLGRRTAEGEEERRRAAVIGNPVAKPALEYVVGEVEIYKPDDLFLIQQQPAEMRN